MMKKLQLLALVLLTTACISAQKVEVKAGHGKVSGVITKTSSYCGGARPSDEMLNRLATPVPNAGAVLYVKRGKVNNMKAAAIDSVVADQDGKFTIKLPPGDYVFVDKRRVDNQFFQMMLKEHSKETDHWSPVDVKCLKEWVAKPILAFTVVENSDQLLNDINIHQPCNWKSLPCMSYKGPYPP